MLDKSTTKVQQPPRNTGTLAGVFQAPATTIYRYRPALSVTLRHLSGFWYHASISNCLQGNFFISFPAAACILVDDLNLIAVNDDVCNRQVTSLCADYVAQKSIRLNIVLVRSLIVGISLAHPALSSSTAILIEVVAAIYSHVQFIKISGPCCVQQCIHPSPIPSWGWILLCQ